MTTALTTQQISILRRVGDGLALPAYVFRPRNFGQDVELLLFFRLISSGDAGLLIEPAGSQYLSTLDATGSPEPLAGLRVSHGRDQSISIERWPQEY